MTYVRSVERDDVRCYVGIRFPASSETPAIPHEKGHLEPRLISFSVDGGARTFDGHGKTHTCPADEDREEALMVS